MDKACTEHPRKRLPTTERAAHGGLTPAGVAKRWMAADSGRSEPRKRARPLRLRSREGATAKRKYGGTSVLPARADQSDSGGMTGFIGDGLELHSDADRRA